MSQAVDLIGKKLKLIAAEEKSKERAEVFVGALTRSLNDFVNRDASMRDSQANWVARHLFHVGFDRTLSFETLQGAATYINTCRA